MWPYNHHFFSADFSEKLAELKLINYKLEQQTARKKLYAVLTEKAEKIESLEEKIGYFKALRDMFD